MRLLNRLRWDRAASASLEFAIVASVMVVLFLGTIEIVNVVRVQAKLNVTAGQLAEMIAGQSTVTEGATARGPGGTLSDMCTGASYNMLPYKPSNLSGYIGSISAVNKGQGDQISLDWIEDQSCPSTANQIGTNPESTVLVNISGTPFSMYTQSGAPAGSPPPVFSNSYVVGFSAIEVHLIYAYSNVLPFILGPSITLTADAVARPRSDTTITCTYGTATPPLACPGS